MVFKFEDDLLKHYVRTRGWLPTVKRRLARIRESARKPADARRLRYFTFCAVGAADVLMLDVAKVVRQSADGVGFDTVAFFDRNREAVLQTQSNIPGARGFVGNFTELVLLGDDEADPLLAVGEALDPPTTALDTDATRRRQIQIAERRLFIAEFPFDVINLDIEEFAFKPRDPLPGRVVNSLRRLCAWQRNPLRLPAGRTAAIDGFSLMFTTQVGPPNISPEYREMLSGYLSQNLADDPELGAVLEAKVGHADVTELERSSIDLFFTLALPKVLASIVMEEDWYVDPTYGVSTYTIERPSTSGPYTILHIVMDVNRQEPPRDQRAPGLAITAAARASYRQTIRVLFEQGPQAVTDAIIDSAELNRSLELIKARRRKYNPD